VLHLLGSDLRELKDALGNEDKVNALLDHMFGNVLDHFQIDRSGVD
jgi:hypothetical protein